VRNTLPNLVGAGSLLVPRGAGTHVALEVTVCVRQRTDSAPPFVAYVRPCQSSIATGRECSF
jgi:hypothetical protein